MSTQRDAPPVAESAQTGTKDAAAPPRESDACVGGFARHVADDTEKKVATTVAKDIARRGIQRLQLASLQLGASVSKALLGSAVSSAALTRIAALEATAGTVALTSAAQMQALGLIALKVPLGSAGAGSLQQCTAAIASFVVANEAAVARVAQMPALQQVLHVGLASNAVSTVVAAAIQESLAVAYLVAGQRSLVEFKEDTVSVLLASAGSMCGGAAGAALGTLVVPGGGTALGALVGSLCGSFAPQALCGKGAAAIEAPPHRRPLRVVSRPGGWLEVCDAPRSGGGGGGEALDADDCDVATDVVFATSSIFSLAATEEDASGGSSTDAVSCGDTDVVLLFRQMPPLEGDESDAPTDGFDAC